MIEGRLKFNFPTSFNVISFDDSNYYREYFIKIDNGLKAIDILAINNSQNYMIEVKDYTHPDTKNLSENQLIEDIFKKIICSLSAIYLMSLKANIQDEKDIANKFLENNELFIIFHIEIPPKRKGLRQSTFNIPILQQALRKKLKFITNKTNIKVVTKANLQNLPWSVSIATP